MIATDKILYGVVRRLLASSGVKICLDIRNKRGVRITGELESVQFVDHAQRGEQYHIVFVSDYHTISMWISPERFSTYGADRKVDEDGNVVWALSDEG